MLCRAAPGRVQKGSDGGITVLSAISFCISTISLLGDIANPEFPNQDPAYGNTTNELFSSQSSCVSFGEHKDVKISC